MGLLRGSGRDLDRTFPDRRDLKRYSISPEVCIDVYWKHVNQVGDGTALSLYVLGHEVLKFDCLGPDDGHFHAEFMSPDKPRESRLFFAEKSHAAQIDRTLFELLHNVPYYLQRHPNRDVRALVFPVEKVSGLEAELRPLMLEYQERVERSCSS